MVLGERIIHESLRLFSLKGFLSTSIDDILKAANASKGRLYNHFPTKEALFLEVLENHRDQYLKDTEVSPGGCTFVTFCVELGLGYHSGRLAESPSIGVIGAPSLLIPIQTRPSAPSRAPRHSETHRFRIQHCTVPAWKLSELEC